MNRYHFIPSPENLERARWAKTLIQGYYAYLNKRFGPQQIAAAQAKRERKALRRLQSL